VKATRKGKRAAALVAIVKGLRSKTLADQALALAALDRLGVGAEEFEAARLAAYTADKEVRGRDAEQGT
jgi:hypothetical protein